MTAPVHAAGRIPEYRTIGPLDAAALSRLFARFLAQGIDKFFHPHPFTGDEAAKRAAYTGKDFYCLMRLENETIGYGMLRGWDEGFAIPSLGCAIDLTARGRGYGRLLMGFLHATARQRGARRIRLKVNPDNTPALTLYRSLGYVVCGEEAGQLLAFLELPTSSQAPQGDGIQ